MGTAVDREPVGGTTRRQTLTAPAIELFHFMPCRTATGTALSNISAGASSRQQMPHPARRQPQP